MSQGIEIIGKPLGPQQAGHVLDLKPSQIFVGRRSLTTRHQFSMIVMGLSDLRLQKTVPSPSLLVRCSPFLLLLSSHSSVIFRTVNRPLRMVKSSIFRGFSSPSLFHALDAKHPPLLGFHLPWSAMVLLHPGVGVHALELPLDLVLEGLLLASQKKWWWNDPMKYPDGSCEKSLENSPTEILWLGVQWKHPEFNG